MPDIPLPESSHRIVCACEESFVNITLAEMHFRETGHKLASGQLTLLEAKLRANGTALEAARLRVTFLETDDKRMRNIIALSTAEHKVVIKPRPCITCRKLTTDRFGAVARCGHHVSNDPVMVSILDTLMNT